MQLRKKKAANPYDIWTEENSRPRNGGKLHPSSKRNKKNPLPHPGQSYNPDPEDHKRLLNKVLEKELELKRKEVLLRKTVDVKVDIQELKKDEKEELEAGIKHLMKKDSTDKTRLDCDSDSATDEANSDYDEKDFQSIMKDKKVKEKRKSHQQRLRQLKDRLQRRAAKLRKLKNIRLSKFDAIKKMIKELNKKEKEEALKMKTKKKHRAIKNERLGQKFTPSDPIYCLTDELPSNLRQVSCPMDKIVREQLESFQSRLMVEPTSFQVKKRKFKKRKFGRHDDDEEKE